MVLIHVTGSMAKCSRSVAQTQSIELTLALSRLLWSHQDAAAAPRKSPRFGLPVTVSAARTVLPAEWAWSQFGQ